MKTYSWLAGIVLAAGLSLSVAAEPQSEKEVVSTPPVVSTADSLEIVMDQWYQFTLTGNDSEAGQLEHDVIRLLNIDINQTQERLSKLLEQLRSSRGDANASFTNADSQADPARDSADFLRSALNVKRILLTSISKSDAFSNKYRLLGDYVELLRREVGLPKLKLAAEKHIEAQKN